MQYSPNSISDPSSFISGTQYYIETTTSSSHSDEEVILAAAHPKKRAGRKKFKETRHPVYRGVRLRNSNKWVCELREPHHQKRIWLGTYPTAEMAARAHDVAALALRGSAACLNFADSVWRLPVPSSTDAKDLRKAAAEAAEWFRPRAGEEEVNYVEQGSEETVDEGGAAADFSGLYEVCEGSSMAGLADGVLMSPPPLYGWSFSWDEMEADAELQLWSF